MFISLFILLLCAAIAAAGIFIFLQYSFYPDSEGIYHLKEEWRIQLSLIILIVCTIQSISWAATCYDTEHDILDSRDRVIATYKNYYSNAEAGIIFLIEMLQAGIFVLITLNANISIVIPFLAVLVMITIMKVLTLDTHKSGFFGIRKLIHNKALTLSKQEDCIHKARTLVNEYLESGKL